MTEVDEDDAMYTEQQELISKMAAMRWVHRERDVEEKRRE